MNALFQTIRGFFCGDSVNAEMQAEIQKPAQDEVVTALFVQVANKGVHQTFVAEKANPSKLQGNIASCLWYSYPQYLRASSPDTAAARIKKFKSSGGIVPQEFAEQVAAVINGRAEDTTFDEEFLVRLRFWVHSLNLLMSESEIPSIPCEA